VSCVLTLALDDASQQRFEVERRRYFPPALNRIPAHLTLFHTLPEEDHTNAALRSLAVRTTIFSVHVSEVRSIGRGVAFAVQSPELLTLHRSLRAAFEQVLSVQDRQGFRPHVVAQNKVTPEVARETLKAFHAEFVPWESQGVGLDLWRYLGGPWEHLERFPFILS
jgi:2'-5' RNA ligase